MSSTTTITRARPTSTAEVNVLAAYDIQHTGADEDHEGEQDLATAIRSPPSRRQLEDWPQDRRRIPTYRETDRSRAHFSERVLGEDWSLTILVTVTFAGNFINGQILRLWRKSTGKELVRYPVGGEW